jgi:hypothetical protein
MGPISAFAKNPGALEQLFSITLAFTLLLVGCHNGTDDYLAVASISESGFARDGGTMRKTDGEEARLWGYVDHGNMSGDEGVRKILGEWWSGAGASTAVWRFNLKAKPDDQTGHSFAVLVPNDGGRDDLLKLFLADAQAGRPTKIFVKGRLFAYNSPT